MKNKSCSKLLFRILSILFALGFTALVLMLAKANPLEAFGHIVKGAVSSRKKIADVFVVWVPLVIVASGLSITFLVGLWNIGVEGQITLGAIMSTLILRNLQPLDISPTISILLAALAGLAGGMAWALIAGILKIYGGVNEIFAGLGLNFIATGLSLWLIFGPWKRPGVGSMSGTEPFDVSLNLPTLIGYRLSGWALSAAILSIILVFLFLKTTRFGIQMKAVGSNPKAAALLGISSKKYYLFAFLLCGAFAGLAGWIQVVAVYHKLIPSISSGYGFLALLVSMLVNHDPLWSAPVALLFAAFNIGGIQLPIEMRIDSTLSGVLQSSLVFFFLFMEGVRKKLEKKASSLDE